jgi:hypothetical protein
METIRLRIYMCCCIMGIIAGLPSCKKEPPVNYTSVTLTIGLVDYSFAPYTSGSWSTGTKIQVKYGGVVLDSLNSLYGAFNLSRSTYIGNACTEPMHTLSHSFRIRNNVLNTVEISDQTGVRLTYNLSPSAIYLNYTSDSTTSTMPNSGCHLSLFPIR